MEEIKKYWEENFRKSPLVRYGKYNQSAVCQVFWNSNPCIPGRFKKGFRYFHDHFNYYDPTKELDLLVDYLDYIGIKIRKEAILEAVQTNVATIPMMLQKCFLLFKGLAMHHGRFDINDPFRKAQDQIQYLLKIEAVDINQRRRLIFLGRRPA